MAQPEPIAFNAQLWRISQDQDGESRVTFAIPLSDLERVLKLGQYTQKLLMVTVRVEA
jgi:hypothetical protein